MKKEISCSNTFLPYVSDKTKKNGKIFVYYPLIPQHYYKIFFLST